jgi:hypothetical protein
MNSTLGPFRASLAGVEVFGLVRIGKDCFASFTVCSVTWHGPCYTPMCALRDTCVLVLLVMRCVGLLIHYMSLPWLGIVRECRGLNMIGKINYRNYYL